MNILDKITEKTANLFFSFFGLKIKPDGSSEFKGKVRFFLNEIDTKWAKLVIFDDFLKISSYLVIFLTSILLSKIISESSYIIGLLIFGIVIRLFIKNKIYILYSNGKAIRPDLNSQSIKGGKGSGFLYDGKNYYFGDYSIFHNKNIPKQPIIISEEYYLNNLYQYKNVTITLVLILLWFPLFINYMHSKDWGYILPLAIIFVLILSLWMLSKYLYNKNTNKILKELGDIK